MIPVLRNRAGCAEDVAHTVLSFSQLVLPRQPMADATYQGYNMVALVVILGKLCVHAWCARTTYVAP